MSAGKPPFRAPARHELAWLHPDAWAEVLARWDSSDRLCTRSIEGAARTTTHAPDTNASAATLLIGTGAAGPPRPQGIAEVAASEEEVATLAFWAERGHPLVARRRGAGDPAGTVALGLPLPPRLGKRRLALAVSPSAIADIEPMPPLAALRDPPAPWRQAVEAIVALGRRCGAEPRVFGSLAWAHLTGLDYVAPGSDLDLLWPLTPTTPDLLAALPSIAAPGRLDGEIVDGAGRGVQWRELAGGGEVMAKALDGVSLVEAAAFLRGEAA